METKEKTKWNPEKLAEMEKWRIENNATKAATSNHFGVNKSTYYAALYDRRHKKTKETKTAAPVKHQDFMTPTAEPAAKDTGKKVAIIICPVDELKHILGGLN